MSTRKAAVMGQFYPTSPDEIEKAFEYYNEIVDKNLEDKSILEIHPRAVIVPHAGYIYSAFTANIAFRVLKNSNPKRVVVIGPSHRVFINGASVAMYDSYFTPFGNLQIDTQLSKEIKEKFSLVFKQDAHNEHSTEVQMPFLKYYMSDVKVVEIVYAELEPQHLAKIIEFILQDKENAVVISSDLSHYYDIQKANRLDGICLDAIATLDIHKLHSGCEACGIIGIEGVIITAKELSLKPILLDYRTSADASGDKSAVVGYMSAALV